MSKEREYHDDGSYTDRYDDHRNTSITYNSDGSTREHSRDENAFWGHSVGDSNVRVTYDEDGDTINVQSLK